MEEVAVLIARSQAGDKEAREVLIEKPWPGASHCEALFGQGI